MGGGAAAGILSAISNPPSIDREGNLVGRLSNKWQLYLSSNSYSCLQIRGSAIITNNRSFPSDLDKLRAPEQSSIPLTDPIISTIRRVLEGGPQAATRIANVHLTIDDITHLLNRRSPRSAFHEDITPKKMGANWIEHWSSKTIRQTNTSVYLHPALPPHHKL